MLLVHSADEPTSLCDLFIVLRNFSCMFDGVAAGSAVRNVTAAKVSVYCVILSP